MMAVYDNMVEPCRLQPFYDEQKKRCIQKRKQRLRPVCGIGQQPDTETGCEYHGLHYIFTGFAESFIGNFSSEIIRL
jgi:hypothetical protein